MPSTGARQTYSQTAYTTPFAGDEICLLYNVAGTGTRGPRMAMTSWSVYRHKLWMPLSHLIYISSCLNLRGRPDLSSFSRAYTAYAARGAIRFSKCFFMVHCNFEKGPQNLHFKSTLFVGKGGSQEKSTLCTSLVIMLTIVDDPLYDTLVIVAMIPCQHA